MSHEIIPVEDDGGAAAHQLELEAQEFELERKIEQANEVLEGQRDNAICPRCGEIWAEACRDPECPDENEVFDE